MNAGSGYQEVWIRDLNTFIVPLLEAVPREQVREALLVFFHFQEQDGNIVDGYVQSDQDDVAYQYRSSDTRPEFKAHKNTVETDQESSLVQAVCRYIRSTGDLSILEERIGGQTVRLRLERALEFPLNHRVSEKYGLIWGATTADWGDVQPENEWGVELDKNSHRAIDIYDNAFFLVAVKEFMDTVWQDDENFLSKWKKRHRALSEAVREHLWDEFGQKFIPHLYLKDSPFAEDFDEAKVYYHGGTGMALEARLLTNKEILIAYGQMKSNLRLSGAATLGLTFTRLTRKANS